MIVSLDLETTGLDERIYEAWEVAYVTEGGDERCWQFPLRRPGSLQEEALEISGYYARFRCGFAKFTSEALWDDGASRAHVTDVAREIANTLDGATLMGCAIQFDMRFLTELLRAWGSEPTWHHRALDLGSYAAGVVSEEEPLSSNRMQEIVPNERAHTALGDAQWNWAVYRRLQDWTGWKDV